MPVLEFLRQYTLREYTAVLAIALLGAAGVVLMLNAASGGAAGSGDVLLKRESASRMAPMSVRSADAEQAAAAERAKHAHLIAERRRIRDQRDQRAARRAARVAEARARNAASRTVVHNTPRAAAAVPVPVVNRTPAPVPQQKRAVAPAPKPTPKKSGATGGGGGSFDDSG